MNDRAKWLAAAAGMALLAGPATARHSWKNYHWPIPGTNAPFEVYTALSAGYWRSMSVGTESVDIIGDAIADWGGDDPDATYTDYLAPALAGTSTNDPATCNPISAAILVCSAEYGSNGWLGLATIWIEGSHIYQATTQLNDSYHKSGTYSSYSWRATVACQEAGHDFGLGHQDEASLTDRTQSCMEYTSWPENNETPDGHDYEQLKKIYDSHMAEGTGGGGGGKPPGKGKPSDAFAFRELGSAPSVTGVRSRAWGTAVAYDAHGRPNVFELDLGGGERKITHVTWVPGFQPKAHHLGGAH